MREWEQEVKIFFSESLVMKNSRHRIIGKRHVISQERLQHVYELNGKSQ